MDVPLSLQQTRVRRRTADGTVGGRSGPKMGKWWIIVISTASLPRISPFQAHNSLIRELDAHWNRSAADPVTPGSSNKAYPQGKQDFQIR